jgi:hypothetical protein
LDYDTSANIAVLINGEPSTLFHSGIGFRQGCPLSLILFILAMEGLSLLLKKIQVEGRITGIKVSRLIKILHLLFFNDVLILTNANLTEWKEISKILNIFCSSLGLPKLGSPADHFSTLICPPLHWLQVPKIL